VVSGFVAIDTNYYTTEGSVTIGSFEIYVIVIKHYGNNVKKL